MSKYQIYLSFCNKNMYNLQTKKKKQDQQNRQRVKATSLKRFVQNYYQKERPQLLNNHNKRVNDFIRKLQHEPIIVKLDPYQTIDSKKKQIKFRNPKNIPQGKRRMETKTTMSHKNSMESYEGDEVTYETFKFKNTEDWTSLYTPWERIQRQKNYKVFKQKYGDPSIAFRSIGSQSQYHPYHDFRQRKQSLQINPPMKYTSKPTEQVLAKTKSKYKNKAKQKNSHQSHKIYELKGFDIEKHLIKSSAQSAAGNDENFIVENFTTQYNESHFGFGGKDSENNQGDKKDAKAKKKEEKVYFKEIVQFQQNTGDQKSKKLLKQILTKCGVYRKKNRRAITDTEVDEFDNLADSHHS